MLNDNNDGHGNDDLFDSLLNADEIDRKEKDDKVVSDTFKYGPLVIGEKHKSPNWLMDLVARKNNRTTRAVRHLLIRREIIACNEDLKEIFKPKQ